MQLHQLHGKEGLQRLLQNELMLFVQQINFQTENKISTKSISGEKQLS